MKHTERGVLEKPSQVQQGYSFTGLIYPEWCLTPLKAHILPLHLNPHWIFRSRKRLRISQVPPSGCGWRVKKGRMKLGKKRRRMWVWLHHMLVSLFLFAGAESPHFTLLINPPPPSPAFTEQAQEAYSVRHIDRVSGEAATGTRITWIMSHRLQGWLGTEIRSSRW